MSDSFNFDNNLNNEPENLDAETRRLLRETHNDAEDNGERIRKLEEKVAHLSLMTEALWTLLNKRTKLTKEDLMGSVQEVMQAHKARDEIRLTCVKCKMQNSVNHKKCMYCGGELIGHPEKNPFNP